VIGASLKPLMLSAHAGLITIINANGRIILVIMAILIVPGIIH
jgi:hypothetical protein